MSELVQLIIQIVTGAIGGNIAGGAAKKISLGTTGNSIAGAVGGLILGQILSYYGMGGSAEVAATAGTAPAAGGFDVGTVIAQIVGGGAGGAILTAVIGAIRQAMQK